MQWRSYYAKKSKGSEIIGIRWSDETWENVCRHEDVAIHQLYLVVSDGLYVFFLGVHKKFYSCKGSVMKIVMGEILMLEIKRRYQEPLIFFREEKRAM